VYLYEFQILVKVFILQIFPYLHSQPHHKFQLNIQWQIFIQKYGWSMWGFTSKGKTQKKPEKSLEITYKKKQEVEKRKYCIGISSKKKYIYSHPTSERISTDTMFYISGHRITELVSE
jgi:hypothetical protein